MTLADLAVVNQDQGASESGRPVVREHRGRAGFECPLHFSSHLRNLGVSGGVQSCVFQRNRTMIWITGLDFAFQILLGVTFL